MLNSLDLGKVGEITCLRKYERFLVVATEENYFSVYDISLRNPKQILNNRRFDKNGEALGEIRDISINSAGNYLGIVADALNGSEIRVPDTKFFIYDLAIDSFVEHEISANVIPAEIVWDYSDPRIFGVQTEYAREVTGDNDDDQNNKNYWFGSEFYVFFYTTDYGVTHQETHQISNSIQGAFGLCCPNIYFVTSAASQDSYSLVEKRFQFFEGISDLTEELKDSLVEFSFYIATGKLDEAYKIIKNIKNERVWANLAKTCIKKKRLDVLEICLSNMRFAKGIKAVM